MVRRASAGTCIAALTWMGLVGPSGEARANEAPSWVLLHRDGSQALVAWQERFPEAAQRLFDWDRAHPLRAQYFLRWLFDHPRASLDDFAAQNPDWPVVAGLFAHHPAALHAFVEWGQTHPPALFDLGREPGRLNRVGVQLALAPDGG